MNYTKEQLIKIDSNLLSVNIKAKEVLKVIRDGSEISNKDISEETNLSKFVIDKCIAAFVGCGLITTIADGTTKYYRITEEGEKILNINREGK
ncbi:hypothetical protein [Clostridium saccharoperbutylacetonicum]|uniref:hypothetical protein n=1 Tax=Clostridium saccharoperbutylacetonicum TaxID=36745 RepID=UPI0039EBDE77